MFAELTQPSVLVLGLGESGLAMARWCARFGCAVRVADTRTEPPGLGVLRAEVARAEFTGGAFTDALLDGVQLIALSPGLVPQTEPLAGLLAEAARRGIGVWGEIELFAQALAHLKRESGYAPKLLAITGTNGKTTTTRLTGQLCERAGKRVAVAGNISPSALDKLADCIDSASLPDVWVLELSSFQLAGTHSLVADAAAVLNLTQDHLDWHGTMQDYADAKARIFGEGTVQVLNRADPRVMAMRRVAADGARAISFGLDAPESAGDFGLVRDNSIDWLACAEIDDSEAPLRPSRRKQADAPALPLRVKRLMPVDALQIRGLHNALNAQAALALAQAIGLPLGPLLHGLRAYRGEPHRVEHVVTLEEVDYFDDSKGTNVGATVAALSGLSRQVVLIAGGEGKGQDFGPLAAPVARFARAVVLIGRDAPRLREALAGTGVALLDCATLEEAVTVAAAHAQPGDAVLLSPACASLDMFRDYKHRAEIFVDAVQRLTLDRGGMR